MVKQISLGMVGLGGISYVHEAGYQELGEAVKITAMCDVDIALAESRAAPYGAKAYSDYRDLISGPNVMAVDLTVPHDLHYPVAKAAMEAGKHVIVEKPLATSYAQALELVSLAREHGVMLFVAENTRFVRAYTKAKELIDERSLGEIWLVRTSIAGSEVERLSGGSSWIRSRSHGGGVILDAGVHSFYLLRWLFGGARVEAARYWSVIGGTEVEDNAVVMGTTGSGAKFRSELSDTAQAPWTERLEVYGSRGALIVDQLANPPAQLYAGPDDYKGSPVEGVEYKPETWKMESIMEEVAAFIRSLVEGHGPDVDPEDAAYAVKLAEDAYSIVEPL